MKLVDCSCCGSKELVDQDGLIMCLYCRSKFVPQQDDLAPVESIIGMTSDIQALLDKCLLDPHNSRRYANLILDMDPSNQQARQYL